MASLIGNESSARYVGNAVGRKSWAASRAREEREKWDGPTTKGVIPEDSGLTLSSFSVPDNLPGPRRYFPFLGKMLHGAPSTRSRCENVDCEQFSLHVVRFYTAPRREEKRRNGRTRELLSRYKFHLVYRIFPDVRTRAFP